MSKWIKPTNYVEKKFNYTYKLTLKEDPRYYYFGVHSSNTDPQRDYYNGSGRGLNKYKIKYGKDCFIREELEFFPTKEEACEAESLLVTEKTLKDPFCLNIAKGGGTVSCIRREFTNEEREKVSLRFKGKKQSPEQIAKRQKTRKERGLLHPSEETKKKLSQARKGKKGHPQSEATREKIRQSHLGNKNGMWGRSPSQETIQKAIETKIKNGTLKHSEETRQKLARKNREKTQDPEYLRKLSEACKGVNTWSKGRLRYTSPEGKKVFITKEDVQSKEKEGYLKGWLRKS